MTRTDEQVPKAPTRRAVAIERLVLRQRRRQRHRELDIPAVATRLVRLAGLGRSRRFLFVRGGSHARWFATPWTEENGEASYRFGGFLALRRITSRRRDYTNGYVRRDKQIMS